MVSGNVLMNSRFPVNSFLFACFPPVTFSVAISDVVSNYLLFISQQARLSVTKFTRLQLIFTTNPQKKPQSTVHTVFPTTIKSSGTNYPGTTNCSFWDTC